MITNAFKGRVTSSGILIVTEDGRNKIISYFVISVLMFQYEQDMIHCPEFGENPTSRGSRLVSYGSVINLTNEKERYNSRRSHCLHDANVHSKCVPESV